MHKALYSFQHTFKLIRAIESTADNTFYGIVSFIFCMFEERERDRERNREMVVREVGCGWLDKAQYS